MGCLLHLEGIKAHYRIRDFSIFQGAISYVYTGTELSPQYLALIEQYQVNEQELNGLITKLRNKEI